MSNAPYCRFYTALFGLLILAACATNSQVNIVAPALEEESQGRLFVVFSQTDADQPEVAFSRSDEEQPRFLIGWPIDRASAAPFFAMDVEGWNGQEMAFLPTASYPLAEMSDLPPGTWKVQALYDTNSLLSDVNSPGNLYSATKEIELSGGIFELELDLTEEVDAEVLPADSEILKFVKIRSDLLSEFYQTDIYLRASILLPKNYQTDAGVEYPVLYQIGGLNDRYDRSLDLLEDPEFRDYWLAEDAPELVVVFLDGESPWGDSYQVNSAVSGPYADANYQELFPYLAENFPIADESSQRFVSGCSTGGWVSMALQVFYPEYFNGAYSFSPDSPSFSAFQLVDLYGDTYAFENEYGVVRPSMRQTDGEPMFGVQDEILAEAAMGSQGNFLNSGQQWGTWNVVYGQLDAEGQPIPVWNQSTGEIDKDAVKAWSKWDVNRHLADNWQTLGPKLEGKLNFWMGGMDNFYLTPGLKILEKTLSEQTNPISDASFTWAPYHGHCEVDNRTYYFDVFEALSERAGLN
jgi:S-formylglutathione hydrolase FrmB